MLYVFRDNRTIFTGSPEQFLQDAGNDPNIKELIEDAKANGSSEFGDKTAGTWLLTYRDHLDREWCHKHAMWAFNAAQLELTDSCMKKCDGCVYLKLVNEADADAFEAAMEEKIMNNEFMGCGAPADLTVSADETGPIK